jgi:hypothetical protein
LTLYATVHALSPQGWFLHHDGSRFARLVISFVTIRRTSMLLTQDQEQVLTVRWNGTPGRMPRWDGERYFRGAQGAWRAGRQSAA